MIGSSLLQLTLMLLTTAIVGCSEPSGSEYSDEQKLFLDKLKSMPSTGGRERVTYSDEGEVIFFDLNKMVFHDDEWSILSTFNTVVHLNIMVTNVKDGHFKEISNMSTLELLNVSDTGVSKSGVELIAKIKGLRILNLANTNIGDDSLEALVAMESVEKLRLDGTNITDESVVVLSKFDVQLRELDIRRTAVTEEGYQTLGKQLPETTILYKDK